LERTRRRCDDDGDDVVFDIFRLLLPNVSDGCAKSDDKNESQESILVTDSESDPISLLSHSITGKALTLLLLKVVVLSLKFRPKNSQEREESTLLPILIASLVLYCASSNACVAGDEIVGTIFAYIVCLDLILLLVLLAGWFSFRVCVRSIVTLCRSCVVKGKSKRKKKLPAQRRVRKLIAFAVYS
jgi:hypothetical protein